MNSSQDASCRPGVLFGTLIGTILGVGIGLAVAPEKGDEFRRRAAFHMENLSRYLADLKVRMSRIQVESEARRTASELVAGVRREADQIMKDANDLINEIKRSQDTAS